MKKLKRIVLSVISWILIVIFSLIITYMIYPIGYTKEEVIVEETIIDSLSFKEEVYNYLKQMNVQHPDIVYAQAVLESGHFKSQLFIEHNNMFGMTVAKQRPTTAFKISNSVYAGYESWQHSIMDYAYWQLRYAHNLTKEQYFEKLKIYAQDPQYIVKLKSIIQ